MKRPNLITTICAITITIILLVVALGIFTRNHLTEGEVISKEIYPPTAKRWYPTYVITVKNGDEFDVWYVTEAYYDSVHIGSYVKK